MSPRPPSAPLASEQEPHYDRVRAAAHALSQHTIRLRHAVHWAFPENRGEVRVHGVLGQVAAASGYHPNQVRTIRDSGAPPAPDRPGGSQPDDQDDHYARVRAAAEAGEVDQLRDRLHYAIYWAFPESRGWGEARGVLARLAVESGYSRHYVRAIRDGDPPEAR